MKMSSGQCEDIENTRTTLSSLDFTNHCAFHFVKAVPFYTVIEWFRANVSQTGAFLAITKA